MNETDEQPAKRRRVDFPVPRGVVEHRQEPCKACGQPIVFFNPTAGRSPLDVASSIDDPANPTSVRLESHFAHCPRADTFRRAGDRRKARQDLEG